LKAITITIAIA